MSSDVALTFILLWMLACDYFLSYRTQGSKFPLQKSHLLATFSCKMITIEKIWLPNKKSHWRTLHAALLAVICLLIQPNIDGFFKIFFFQICWQLSPKFQWPNFSHAMVTKTIATWSIAASILINLELNLWGSICPYDSFIISHLRLNWSWDE